MAKPSRYAGSDEILSNTRTFFATTKAHMGQRLLQSERNAELLIEVMRSCVAEKRFQLHDFVVMPDHMHLLVTVDGAMSIEKAMQLIKGRFSYRLKKESGYLGEVWQRGFSEARADQAEVFASYRKYIAENPVRAGLVERPEQYPYSYCYLAAKKAGRG
jgi:putative transposase